MKAKLVFGYFLIAVVSFSACLYGLSRFRQMEPRLKQVNEEYLPLFKLLNQWESSFFLLEGDMDKMVVEGNPLPRDLLFQGWENRIQAMQDLSHGDFSGDVNRLLQRFKDVQVATDSLLSNWNSRDSYLPVWSEKRANLRSDLMAVTREVDHRIRSTSLAVESEVKHSGVTTIGILAFSALAVCLLIFWLNGTLAPLSKLTDEVKRISRNGLDEAAIQNLAALPVSQDEVGIFSTEFRRMASSLFDQHLELSRQREALEKTHEEMARANKELRRAQDKIAHQEKLSIVGKLAAQMAHEIRNPLNAIGLHLDILKRELGDVGENGALLGPLQHELSRLIDVTEGYLEMARAPRWKEENVNLNEVVEEVRQVYEPLFTEHQIKFSVDCGEVPVLEFDKGKMAQVLGNLVKNAAEAFDGLEKPLKFIRISTNYDRDKKSLVLSVMDNGMGIRKEAGKDLFAPFFTTKAQGTGLGLAHSKQIIEEHGGEISFESQNGQGTKFTIRLPVLDLGHRGNA